MLSVEVSGLFGLVILVLDVMAIIKTVQSRASTSTKVLWVVAILLLPVLGLILWFLFGPRD
ncbi:PLDc N-terminal domain-containing protein [Marinobacterium weihaiense]|uniref:PLDc N-terminal domain-containing protein n=1 Tax=Marinobacterium weihaiense TaxID=2851016 RepID=A0ABS6M6H3_9GAMM|nr:PLDc N-terminal domain-containing protein [Marinobacterium weihaiense]MBV0931891.1 PLDc N-terminal domain-containing protein [Marinobacterium weihaiense]